jgi:hypothetical protein
MNKELSPLDAWKDIKEVLRSHGLDTDTYGKQGIVEAALKDYENLQLKHSSMQDAVLDDFKKLKALDIIKKKVSDINWFKCCNSLEDYNGSVPSYKQLTQKEYDLLKEVLL